MPQRGQGAALGYCVQVVRYALQELLAQGAGVVLLVQNSLAFFADVEVRQAHRRIGQQGGVEGQLGVFAVLRDALFGFVGLLGFVVNEHALGGFGMFGGHGWQAVDTVYAAAQSYGLRGQGGCGLCRAGCLYGLCQQVIVLFFAGYKLCMLFGVVVQQPLQVAVAQFVPAQLPREKFGFVKCFFGFGLVGSGIKPRCQFRRGQAGGLQAFFVKLLMKNLQGAVQPVAKVAFFDGLGELLGLLQI